MEPLELGVCAKAGVLEDCAGGVRVDAANCGDSRLVRLADGASSKFSSLSNLVKLEKLSCKEIIYWSFRAVSKGRLHNGKVIIHFATARNDGPCLNQ